MAKVTGGQKIKAAIAELGKKLGAGVILRVGFLAKAKYPDGTPVAMIAAIQEFGAPRRRIPPRPFFRNMIEAKKKEWPKAIGDLVKDTGDPVLALDIAGAAIAGQLKKSIIDTNAPPLSPITLMLRKMKAETPGLVVTGRTVGEAARRVKAGESSAGVSTKPLIETSHLINSVDHEVVRR